MSTPRTVWDVNHFRAAEDEDETQSEIAMLSAKHMGTYSSREKAEAAIARLIGLEGFRDDPGGFRVTEAVVDQDLWPRRGTRRF